MADKKISALTGAATPLAGTEVLPIVQSGSTVKVSIDNVTKGRTVNASSFDTDVAAAGVTLSGNTLAADGTDTNININVTPKGSGALVTTNLTTSGNTILGDAAADTLNFAAGALVKTTDGIFGINTTPSNWAGRAFGYTPFQIGNGAVTDVANVHTELSYNQYVDTGGTRRYITANPAAFHRIGNSTYSWFLAPAGSADAAITFTQVMGIDASGNVTANTGDLVFGTVGKGITTSVTNGNVTVTPLGTGTTVLNRNGVRIPNNAAVTVGTSATQISVNAISWSSVAFVFGVDGGGAAFSDLVFYADGTAVALASRTVSGAPVVRTYTAPGGQLNLAMASGSYSVFFQHIAVA